MSHAVLDTASPNGGRGGDAKASSANLLILPCNDGKLQVHSVTTVDEVTQRKTK